MEKEFNYSTVHIGEESVAVWKVIEGARRAERQMSDLVYRRSEADGSSYAFCERSTKRMFVWGFVY